MNDLTHLSLFSGIGGAETRHGAQMEWNLGRGEG